MDRSIPTSNKIISRKIHDRNMQIHLAKLNSIKSNLSRDAPKQFAHLKLNKKKQQVFEDRLGLIEKDNKKLLDRLTSIMRTTSHNQTGSNFANKSLNRDFRKRELVKITMENQDFLKRLQDQKSVYDRNLWETDNKQHQNYLKNISEYPITIIPVSTPPATNNRPSSIQVSREYPKTISPKKSNTVTLQTTTKQNDFRVNAQPKKKNIPEKLEPVDVLSKRLLYQTKKKIGFSNYLIHIYLHNNTFNIIASNNERADFKAYTATLKEADELITSHGESYEQLVDKIRFKGANIVFENESVNYDGDSTVEQKIPEAHDEYEQDVVTKNQPQQNYASTEKSNSQKNNSRKSIEQIEEIKEDDHYHVSRQKEPESEIKSTKKVDHESHNSTSKKSESQNKVLAESKVETEKRKDDEKESQNDEDIEAELGGAGQEFISKDEKEESEIRSSSRHSLNDKAQIKDSTEHDTKKNDQNNPNIKRVDSKRSNEHGQEERNFISEEGVQEDEFAEPENEEKISEDTHRVEESNENLDNQASKTEKRETKKPSYEDDRDENEYAEEELYEEINE